MLTIVLTLKDRAEFNDRFLNRVKDIYCRVLIADGSEKAPFLIVPLNATYKYFGPDTSISRWFSKVSLALDMVTTPYVMLADNDDLPTKHLSRCVSFLESFPDYVCCSGRIQGFWLWPDPVTGPHSATSPLYSPYDKPTHYDLDTPNARVLAGFTNSWSYYAVYRTEVLRKIWKEVCALNLTDLQVHEKFCAMRTLTLGKAVCFEHLTTLYRQYGTSQAGAFNKPTGNMDMGKVLIVMGALGVDKAILREKWSEWYQSWFSRNYGPWATLRHAARARFPRLAWLAQNRHRYLPHRSLPL